MRWGAGIVGGFLVGLVLYFLASMVATTPQVWVLFVGWIGFGLWFARSGAFAWARAWMIMAISSFALPIAALVFSGRMGAQVVSTAGSEAEKAGAAVGSALGGVVLSWFTGFVGFFLGIIFAILAYFTFNSARASAQKE